MMGHHLMLLLLHWCMVQTCCCAAVLVLSLAFYTTTSASDAHPSSYVALHFPLDHSTQPFSPHGPQSSLALQLSVSCPSAVRIPTSLLLLCPSRTT